MGITPNAEEGTAFETSKWARICRTEKSLHTSGCEAGKTTIGIGPPLSAGNAQRSASAGIKAASSHAFLSAHGDRAKQIKRPRGRGRYARWRRGTNLGCGGSAALPVSLLVYRLLQTCPARVEVHRHKSINTSLLEPEAPQEQKSSSSNNSLCALGSSSYMGHTGVLLLEQNCCILSIYACRSCFFLSWLLLLLIRALFMHVCAA